MHRQVAYAAISVQNSCAQANIVGLAILNENTAEEKAAFLKWLLEKAETNPDDIAGFVSDCSPTELKLREIALPNSRGILCLKHFCESLLKGVINKVSREQLKPFWGVVQQILRYV